MTPGVCYRQSVRSRLARRFQPKDKANHWHAHIDEKSHWPRNVVRRWDGKLQVSILCGWDHSQRKTLPPNDLLFVGHPGSEEGEHGRFDKGAGGYLWDLVMQPSVQAFLTENGGTAVIPFVLPPGSGISICTRLPRWNRSGCSTTPCRQPPSISAGSASAERRCVASEWTKAQLHDKEHYD